MNKKKVLSNYIIKKLFKDGYCIVNNFISKSESEKKIRSLEKLNQSLSKNKRFVDENSRNGQLIIRDLPLRDPKNFL